MNNNIIEIKKQQKNWFTKGIIYLLAMLLSLLIALLPLVIDFGTGANVAFHIIGSIIFLPFSALFVILIVGELNPSTAMTLTAHGFVDIINIGPNIQIEWTNVSAVKMLGKENMPFLGITLENPDIILAKMKKSKAAEITENIEQNLPTILIPQNTVRVSIKELKNIFIKFVREARVLETDAPKKPKNNPFTTDDVLRAFGQLPKDDSVQANDETEVKDNNIINEDVAVENIIEEAAEDIAVEPLETTADSQDEQPSFATEETVDIGDFNANDSVRLDDAEVPQFQNDINQPFTVPATPQSNTAAESSNYTPASDAFYESLRAKAIVKPKTIEEVITNDSYEPENEDCKAQDTTPVESAEPIISSEIEELLNQARSSKITEIEKLLNDEDVPYSIVREKKQDTQLENSSVELVAEDLINEDAEIIPDDNSSDDLPDEQYITDNIDISQNEETQEEINEELPMEDKLAAMIADAIKSTEDDNSDLTVNNNIFSEDPNATTREFVLNLSKALEDSDEK